MANIRLARLASAAWLLLACGGWALQNSSQQPKNNPSQSQGSQNPQQQQQGNQSNQTQSNQDQASTAPAPLFEGKSTLKSSRQGKETATAGFNGIGPDGSVQSSVLNANPSPADAEHVAKMASTMTDPAELAAFAKDGNLRQPK